MAKFCVSCGAYIEDNAMFCNSCGAKQMDGFTQSAGSFTQNGFRSAENFAQSAGQTVRNTFNSVNFDTVKNSMNMENIKNVTKTKNKNTIIGVSAVGTVIVILLVIIVRMLGTPAYQKPINNFCKAVTKTDGKLMASVFPDYMNESTEELIEDYLDDKYDNLNEYYSDMLEELVDDFEDDYGDNIKLTCNKVVKKKEIKMSVLKDMEDDIEDTYDKKVKVQAGYKLKVELKIKGSEDDDSKKVWMDVYKIDGKWCMTSSSMSI